MSSFRSSSRLWTSAEAQAADRYAIDRLEIASEVLMERASLCVAHEVVRRCGVRQVPICVLVGPGNNGGDGLAVARILRGWGWETEVRFASTGRNAAATVQERRAQLAGVRSCESAAYPGPGPRVIIDALLGTGAVGAPRAEIAKVLAEQADCNAWRIAIDAPTGVDVDTGRVEGEAFLADLTVTFGQSKPGLHVAPGCKHAGSIVVADIGLVSPHTTAGDCALIDPWEVAASLRSLPPAAHKGERGHVWVIGGGRATPGAAILAGTSALRAGAGLCTIVSRNEALRAQILQTRPELMIAEPGALGPGLGGAWVVGPGLTDPEDPRELSGQYLEDSRPAVWDASALELVPVDGCPVGPRILTPHPGEAARLLSRAESRDVSARDVQSNRLECARILARRFGAIVILKGEGSLVAHPRGRVAIAVEGSDALATAGSGDCLAGLLGALLARGLDPWDAARIGVHVHAVAGDEARRRRPGPVAGDIAQALDRAMQPDVVSESAPRWPRGRRG